MMEEVEELLDPSSSFTVTGVMMQSYFICNREVWFINSRIELNRDNQHIMRGTRVDNSAYGGSDNLFLGPISADLLDDGRVVEVKPSQSFERGSRMQLAYYLWYLRKRHGIEKDGVLAYPEQREREPVELDEELANQVEEAISGIYEIVSNETPPELEEKPYCQTCAYQDFCWINRGEKNE